MLSKWLHLNQSICKDQGKAWEVKQVSTYLGSLLKGVREARAWAVKEGQGTR